MKALNKFERTLTEWASVQEELHRALPHVQVDADDATLAVGRTVPLSLASVLQSTCIKRTRT